MSMNNRCPVTGRVTHGGGQVCGSVEEEVRELVDRLGIARAIERERIEKGVGMKEDIKKEEKYASICWDGDLHKLIEEFGDCIEGGYKIDLPQFVENLKAEIALEIDSRGINQTKAATALGLNRGTYRKYLKKGQE